MIPRDFWTTSDLLAAALAIGLLIGAFTGFALGVQYADRTMARYVESTAPILAECEVRTVERALALREDWAKVGPTHERGD